MVVGIVLVFCSCYAFIQPPFVDDERLDALNCILCSLGRTVGNYWITTRSCMCATSGAYFEQTVWKAIESLPAAQLGRILCLLATSGGWEPV